MADGMLMELMNFFVFYLLKLIHKETEHIVFAELLICELLRNKLKNH